jgi:hypothetical protein
VTWLAAENGLRFDHSGTVVSAGEFQADGALESSCSIELWVRPEALDDSHTLLAFHTARGPVQLSLHQSITDLEVKRAAAPGPHERRPRHFYAGDVFRPFRPRFITVSSGARGAAVYTDGVLDRFAPGFQITAADCTGRLIVATSPTGSDPWSGRLRGLAIYYRELTPAEVVRHYETWIGMGRPAQTPEERCAALYLFSERGGNLVHNQTGTGPDLLIPERYQIEDQAFLVPFWEQELDPPDMLRNIVAFVPLGFLLYAWLALRPSVRRIALTVTVLGGLLSVTMEILQAWLPTRQSDTMDIVSNTFGTWAGVMLYRYMAARGILPWTMGFRPRPK